MVFCVFIHSAFWIRPISQISNFTNPRIYKKRWSKFQRSNSKIPYPYKAEWKQNAEILLNQAKDPNLIFSTIYITVDMDDISQISKLIFWNSTFWLFRITKQLDSVFCALVIRPFKIRPLDHRSISEYRILKGRIKKRWSKFKRSNSKSPNSQIPK